MSSISTEKYDLVKLERLKFFLETNAESGKPRYFEIYVDNLKAVDKNNDYTCFDDYLLYLNEDSKLVKILIYTHSETSPRNDKFFFSIVNEKEERNELNKLNHELNGLDFQTKIESAISAERERIQTEQLKKELEDTKEELEDAQEYIEELEEKLTTEQNKKHSWKELNLGNVASVAIEEIVKRNPTWMSKVPLLEALSGLNGAESPIANTTTENIEGEVSFSKKGAAKSEEDKAEEFFTTMLLEMHKKYTPEQLEKIIEINGSILQNEELISSIHELIFTQSKAA
jgi:hypothetical protein